MTIEKVEAFEAVCDGCLSIQIVTDVTNIIGYTGQVSEQYETGGSGVVTFFACKATCLHKAIVNVLNEEKNR